MDALPDFDSLSGHDLARMIAELEELETAISRERQVIQGRLDILREERRMRRTGRTLKGASVERLAAILSRRPRRGRGLAIE